MSHGSRYPAICALQSGEQEQLFLAPAGRLRNASYVCGLVRKAKKINSGQIKRDRATNIHKQAEYVFLFTKQIAFHIFRITHFAGLREK